MQQLSNKNIGETPSEFGVTDDAVGFPLTGYNDSPIPAFGAASASVVNLAGSGLVFNNTFGAGVTPAFKAAVIAAENFFQAKFSDTVTLSCSFDLSAMDPRFSGQNTYSPINVSYVSLKAALASHATTSADSLAVASLPTTDPSGGRGFAIAVGEARILGLSGPGSGIDDAIVLNNSLAWTYGQDAIGVIEHEITEGCMGRIGGLGLGSAASWDPMDLFRYSSAGHRDYTGGTDGLPTFFSVDGQTLTLPFHNSMNSNGVFDNYDFADWDSTSGDAFGPGGPGSPGTMSSVDLQVLDVLGWTPLTAPPAVAPVTFNDTTAGPLFVATGLALPAFKAVTVLDTNPLSDTETVTIVLTPNGILPNTDLGSVSDPNGGGTFDAATHTFTENTLVDGSPTGATNMLQRLVYKAPTLPNGQSAEVRAVISVGDNGGPAVSDTAIVIDTVTAPSITQNVNNQPVAGGSSTRPFATTTVIDNDFNFGAKDTIAITITDGGVATDADGLLTGSGLSKTGVGTYSLANPDFVFSVQSELRNLAFAATTLTAGQVKNPQFKLAVTDSKANHTAEDTNTSLLISGPPAAPVAPTIAGALAGQTVAPGHVLDPFASVTIGDANLTPSDTVVITVTDANGTATDANGTLSGTGLTETAPGVYALSGSDAKALTTKIDALTFHPAGLPAGQASVTTNFKITVTDPTVGLSATDTKTAVVETAPEPKPLGGTGNFLIVDETTGQTTQSAGEPFVGPVAGLTSDIMLLTSDNINVTAHVANVFIHTGSGNDAIDVSLANGSNILDGSTGSNFLVGGTGHDTFYVDDRNAGSDIWSTIKNLHSGDDVTVWGLTTNGFTIGRIDNQGAAGSTGLTFSITAPGKPVANVTLAGFAAADITAGRLTVNFGRSPDTPGLPGSDYMQIHAV